MFETIFSSTNETETLKNIINEFLNNMNVRKKSNYYFRNNLT